MTWILIRKLLRDVRWGLLVVALLLCIFQALWVKVTQRISTQMSPMFQAMARMRGMEVKEMEKQLFSGTGRIAQSIIGGEQLRYEKAMDVLSIGLMHPLVQAIFCIWAVGRAAGAVAGELDRGTMELLLAQPIPRGRIILAHFCVDLILIPVLCLSLWAGIWIGTWIVGPFHYDPDVQSMVPFNMNPQLAALAQTNQPPDPKLMEIDRWAFGPPLLNVAALIFAVSGITMWISANGRFRWRTVGIAVLVVLVQFVMNVVGQMIESVAFIRPLSIFYYYQPQHIALHHNWSMTLEPWGLNWKVPVLLVLFAVGSAGYLLAWRDFRRRDLPAPL
jgi:ABC-2 type transport system permease protein